MKFLAHNHYNNNSGEIGEYTSHGGMSVINECAVNVTDAGLVLFMLPKSLDIDEKILLMQKLDEKLNDRYGQGLSLVTSAQSDCLSGWELPKFYSAAKNLESKPATAFVGMEKYGKDADHCFSTMEVGYNYKEIAKRMCEYAGVSQADKKAPKGGWAKYEYDMMSLFADAIYEVVSPDRASQHVRFREDHLRITRGMQKDSRLG